MTTPYRQTLEHPRPSSRSLTRTGRRIVVAAMLWPVFAANTIGAALTDGRREWWAKATPVFVMLALVTGGFALVLTAQAGAVWIAGKEDPS